MWRFCTRLFSVRSQQRQNRYPIVWVHLIQKGPTGVIESGPIPVKVAISEAVPALRSAVREKLPRELQGHDTTKLVVRTSRNAKPLATEDQLQTVLKPDAATGKLSVIVELPMGGYSGAPPAARMVPVASTTPGFTQRAQKFAAVCRVPSESVKVTINSEAWPTIPTDRIVDVAVHGQLEDDADAHLMTASIVPGGWPLFWEEKHNLLASVLYVRQSSTNRRRVDTTIEALQNSAREKDPLTNAWVGAPGIGKSASLNHVLRHFIQHMGEPGFPPVVGLRINTTVVLWEWVADAKEIRVTEEFGVAGESPTLFNVSKTINSKRGILLVNPNDTEPLFAFACPTLIAISSWHADLTLPLIAESFTDLRWLVVGPWARSECLAAAWIEFMMGRRDCGSSCAEVASTMMERWSTVGGVPRFILSGRAFAHRVSEQSRIDSNECSNWKELTAQNVDRTLHTFIAPIPDVSCQPDSIAWEFLSPKRAAAFYASLSSDRDNPVLWSSLKTHGLVGQVLQQFLRDSLLRIDRQRDWEWYPDHGVFEKLNFAQRMEQPPPGFEPSLLKSVEFFDGEFMHADVTRLDPSVLYQPASWELTLGQALSVSLAEKTVFLYQVGPKPTLAPVFKAYSASMWRKALQMPPDWTLAVVCFVHIPKKQMPVGTSIGRVPEKAKRSHVIVGYLVRSSICQDGIYASFRQ